MNIALQPNSLDEIQNYQNPSLKEDRHLMEMVLEIYDQKQIAEKLREMGDSEWTREALNRWLNGKVEQKPLTGPR